MRLDGIWGHDSLSGAPVGCFDEIILSSQGWDEIIPKLAMKSSKSSQHAKRPATLQHETRVGDLVLFAVTSVTKEEVAASSQQRCHPRRPNRAGSREKRNI